MAGVSPPDDSAGNPKKTISWQEADVAESDPGTGETSKDSSPARPRRSEPRISPEFGRYLLDRELGRGAMGVVYLARDRQLDRQVALKIPFFGQDENTDCVERFYREARAMATLHHPNLCPVFDVGEIDGTHYLTMAYIEGRPLASHLRSGRPLPATQAAAIVCKLALALEEAHQAGIVHRDLKPANVMIDQRSEPIIMDFGLARRQRKGEAQLTQTGAILGSPAFMPPEQVNGDQAKIGPLSDVYALGVILYQMLTGKLPFDGPLGTVLTKIMTQEPVAPTRLCGDVPEALERICLQAMSKEVAQRQGSAASLAAELQLFLQSSGALLETMAMPVLPAEPSADAPRIGDSSIGRSPTHGSSAIRSSREAERRQVTLLYFAFALTGDEAGESVDLEVEHDVVGQLCRFCEATIHHFGGTLIPTGTQDQLVCFGYPVSYEDAARRAVQTGLAVLEVARREAAAILRRHDVQLAATIVIHTGLVIVGSEVAGGSNSAMVSISGEARNVAAAMQNVVEADSVVISDTTHHIVQGYFECERLGAQRLKGSKKPLELFAVVGEAAARSRIDREKSAKLTPLVGRDREVGLLEERWEEASEGSGQVVQLIGDAGLGKSRLVHVMKEYVVQQTGAPDAVLEWRCSTFYENTGLYPAVDYFQRRLEFSRTDSPAQKLDKLAAYLAAFELGPADEVVPLFAQLLSVPLEDRYAPLELTPAGQKERTVEVLLDWMRGLMSRQPLLFVMEDLHWVDPSTLEFLTALIDQCAGESMLALFTFRPEFEAPWSSRSHQTQVPLNKLRRKQIAEMVCQQTGVQELPAEVIDKVVERTDGVPLFIEEFAKMIKESGGVREVAGEIQLTASFSLETIPATLQDLLMARLDRMAGLYDVVQLGAALGREFSYELIAAVALSDEALPIDEATLNEELSKLVDAELLFQKGRVPKCTYLFKHALIQDAAYQSLLKKDRQQFHQRIGEVLESSFGELAETNPELLAHHFTEAGDATKAIAYWLQAGQRSQGRSATDEAIEQFGAGLSLVAKLDESADRDQLELGLLVSLGVAYMATKGWASGEVGNTFQKARVICEKLGARDHQFNVMWGTWGWHLLRGEFDACLEIAAETTALAESLQHPALLMEAPWLPGCTQFYRGEFTAALENLRLGFSRWDEELSRETTLATGQNCGVTYEIYGGLALWYLGFPDQAARQMETAVQRSIHLKHLFSESFAWWHTSWFHSLSRDGTLTQDCSQKAFAIADEQSFVMWKLLSLVDLGFGMHLQGRPEDAVAMMVQAAETLQAIGAALSVPHCQHKIAQVKWKLGQTDEALEHLRIEIEHAERCHEKLTLAECHRLRGEILLSQSADHRAAAESCFRLAIEIAQSQQAKSWELRAASSLARLLDEHGQRDEGRKLLENIYNWFTEGFDTADLIDAKSLLERLA